MSTKNQIILLTIIALMASLGFAATTLVRLPSLPQRQQTTVAKKEMQAAPTQSTSTDQVAMAYQSIENVTSSYIGFDLGTGRKTLLISKQSSADKKTNFLWYVFGDAGGTMSNLVKTFPSYQSDVVNFSQDNGETILRIDRQSGQNGSQPLVEYQRFSHDGDSIFTYSQSEDAYSSTAQANDVSIELVFDSSCAKQRMDQSPHMSILTGIRIAGTVYPVTPSKIDCVQNDWENAANFRDQTFSFSEYDPLYRVLKLTLPDKRDVLIDISTKKIVAKEEAYNQPCFGTDGPDWSHQLTYTTPSGTTILVERIADDPLFKTQDLGSNVCLEKLETLPTGNPVFSMYANCGGECEGSTVGKTEFDLKSRTFKKIK